MSLYLFLKGVSKWIVNNEYTFGDQATFKHFASMLEPIPGEMEDLHPHNLIETPPPWSSLTTLWVDVFDTKTSETWNTIITKTMKTNWLRIFMSISYLFNCPSDSNSGPFLQFQSIANRNGLWRKEQSDVLFPFFDEDIFIRIWELFELWEKEAFKLMLMVLTMVPLLIVKLNCVA